MNTAPVLPAGNMLAFCSPFYEDVALGELSALLAARLVHRLAQGTLILASPFGSAEAVAHVGLHPPVFTRQLVVDLTVAPRSGDPQADARTIADLRPAELLHGTLVCDAAGRCPRDLARLHDALKPDIQVVLGATMPLAVVASDEVFYVGNAVVGAGIATAPQWPAGRPDVPYDARLVSRSALKLAEAIELFRVPLTAGGRALDLGASPGGWSQVLLRHGMAVTAVDPGELDPRVQALDGIRIYAVTAQAYLRHTTTRFDLIVDDMRLDPRESARTMVAAQALLRPRGAALITLKLPERAPTAVMRQALNVLRDAYPQVLGRCLYFNRNEITVYARSPG
jgi:hypothetical protein